MPATLDYDHLTRPQKLACFFVMLGPERAAHLLQTFRADEIEDICRNIAEFHLVPEEIQKRVSEEFAELLAHSGNAVLGGASFAQATLSRVKGDFNSSDFLNRLAPLEDTGQMRQSLEEIPSTLIFKFIREEQPQTIAYVLNFLSAERAAEIIGLLGDEAREDVLERVGLMEEVSLEHIQKLIAAMRRRVAVKSGDSPRASEGLNLVASLLNAIDREQSKKLVASLSQRNPVLGQAIQRKMFSFEDLGRLSPRDHQRIMREIESKDLVVALKGATVRLQGILLQAVSKRAAETIREEMEMLGPVRRKEVDDAQDRIIQAVRMLEDEGEITLDPGGDLVG